MAITLESISFNHDPNSATTDALTIRTNRLVDVRVPEWTSGMTDPEQSRAAYIASQIMANELTIEATFRRQPGDDASVGISAIGMTGNVLGNVEPQTIHFGNNDVVTTVLRLESPPDNPGVGRWDISWIWSLGTGPNQTTKHRIYTILDSPKAPWGQASPFALPWTDVLDHACEAAKEAMTLDDAADRLTRWVYSLGQSKLQYNNQNAGSPSFTVPGMDLFKCTDFMRVLNNGNGTKHGVNCSDCATILSCFANILGCKLWQSQIGADFRTNLIHLIGAMSPRTREFAYHEIALKIPGGEAPTVFDCCLKIDGDGAPLDENFLPSFGINLPFGLPGGNDYHGRLIRLPLTTTEPEEWPNTRIQRKIDVGDAVSPRIVEPTQLERLAEQHDFASWNGLPEPKPNCKPRYTNHVVESDIAATSDQSELFKNNSFSEDQGSVVGWKPGEVRVYKAEPEPRRITEVVWLPTDGREAALRVLTYDCSSLPAARSFLLALLAEFNMPGIKRRFDFHVSDKPVKIGDVSFAGPEDLVLLFARANNVVFVQNVGPKPVPAQHLAHQLDQDMAKRFVEPAADSLETECEKLDEKEEKMAIDITGVWSSIRPTNNGRDSADMSVDGVIEIKNADPDTGYITGYYRHQRALSPTQVLKGEVEIVDSLLTINLWHPLEDGTTRHYEGKLVANDGTVQIMAGTFRDDAPEEDEDAVRGSTTTASATAANGQANGTWVATKP